MNCWHLGGLSQLIPSQAAGNRTTGEEIAHLGRTISSPVAVPGAGLAGYPVAVPVTGTFSE
jgi:hypothetical protein